MTTTIHDIHSPVRIITSRFGEIDVDASTVFDFPEGLIGFPDARRFALICDEGPLQWLQSLDNPRLAFVIVDPLLMKPDYRVRVAREELASIRLDAPTDGRVAVILSIPHNPAEMTANLQGPLVFNAARRLAKQLVLIDYTTKHRVLAD